MLPIVSAWRGFDSSKAPYILEGDEALVDERWACRHPSWESFVRNADFGERDDGRLHLDLLPVPFLGNLARASIYLLLLNPGFGPDDYFAEYRVPEFREARAANLQQGAKLRFMDLNPAFSWHAGFRYWHGRLSRLITAFAAACRLSYGESRELFASHIALVELVPYHSKTFALPASILSKLRSVRLAREFATGNLAQRAKQDDCVVVVMRSSRHWGLTAGRNVILYNGAEARSAHLSPDSRGGRAILEFIRRKHGPGAA